MKKSLQIFLLLLVYSNVLIPQNENLFVKILPRSQWSDYSVDKPQSAVTIDTLGNMFIISQLLGSINLVIQKVNPEGEILWGSPDEGLNVSPGMEYGDAGFAPKLTSDENGGVFILYAYSTFIEQGGAWWYDYDVYLQHIDTDGNLLFGDKGIPVLANETVTTEYPKDMITDGNGGVYALYGGESTCPWGTRYLQHIDNSGNLLFLNPGIIVSKCDTVGVGRIAAKPDSGCFLIGSNNFLQKIDSNGEFLLPLPWVNTGLNNIINQYFFNFANNKNILIGLMDNTKTVVAQKFNNDGEVLWGEDGISYTWPDSAFSRLLVSETENNKYFLFSSQYYIILEQDGSFENTIPLRLIKNDSYVLRPISVAYSNQYGFFILYYASEDNNSILFLQNLAVDGSLPWGNEGIMICNTSEILNGSTSIIKVSDESDKGFLFIEFHEGIHLAELDLENGQIVTGITKDKDVKSHELPIGLFPNPFNGSATISYNVKFNEFVTIDIYDILGKKVRTLVNSKRQSGSHKVIWDGKDVYGNTVASGLYFIRIQTPNNVQILKASYLK